ncbi:TIR domain-containing protein [Tepidamorphus sp. 3E244]|uniref:nSTAND1 domain-containing NTPase n=1 Tax=Tepidamorphus sp. 3E244 TaxID=3385498 RepID=UPI0038FC722A
MARIFISHSSRDNAAAMAVSEWLAEQGWNDLFLDLDPHRGLKAGERWQEALKHAAERCQLVLFLVSPAWHDSKWCVAEFLLAKQMNKRIAAAIIEPVDLSDLPSELTAEWQLVDLTAGARDHVSTVRPPPGDESVEVKLSSDGLKRLRIGLAEAGLDARHFAWPPADDPDRSPYRGLKALAAEDAGIFFGRDGQIVLGMDAMRGLREAASPRLMAILGASGAGKSSFMRAGLLPRLTREDRHFLPLPPLRPERAAITGEEGLIAVLEEGLSKASPRPTRAEIRKAIEAGATETAALLKRIGEFGADEDRPTLVLPIDQGEELFAADGAEEAHEFLTLLRELLSDDSVPMIALFTIRSESFEALQSAAELEGVRRVAFDLPPMPRGTYSDVIVGPARRLEGTDRALRIEEQLVERLLADIDQGRGKDALPLLAFTLERLYREHGGDGDLKLEEYEDLGGVAGSIEAAVKQAMKAADTNPDIPRGEAERYALLRRGMIPWLAGIDPETGTPRRRVARLAEIPKDVRPLLQLLVDQRLLATDIARDSGETTIEPAHEALLRQWGLLQTWLEEDSWSLGALDILRTAAREWQANDRDAAWLAHTGGRLEAAETASARPDLAGLLSETERDYLDAARRAETERREAETNRLKKERRLYRMIAGGSVAAALVMGIGAWQIYGLYRTASADKLFWEGMMASASGDNEKSAALLEEARNMGHARAAVMEAMLAKGEGGAGTDDARSAELFQIGADQGDPLAMAGLAELYQTGRGVEQDFAKARALYLQSAEAGNPASWANLADMVLNEHGGEADPALAISYYERGVEAGNSDAMNGLGWVYRHGHGVEADEAKARALFEQGARKGNIKAMNNLADSYIQGFGLEKDYAKALEWSQAAAEQGSDYAMNNVGWIYQNGLGVEVDHERALEHYRQSADLGNADGLNSVATFYENGVAVPQDFAQARRIYQQAADAGQVYAMMNLAGMYYDGRGGEKDLVRVAELSKQAAEGGNTFAYNSLGWLLERGEGVEQDIDAAIHWYGKAAEAGVAQGMYNLGRVHMEGIGVEPDALAGLAYFQQAADNGLSAAHVKLGDIHAEGEVVPADMDKALTHYRTAASMNDPEAMLKLGLMYRDGTGVAADPQAARQWLERAAKAGHPDATAALQQLSAVSGTTAQ